MDPRVRGRAEEGKVQSTWMNHTEYAAYKYAACGLSPGIIESIKITQMLRECHPSPRLFNSFC